MAITDKTPEVKAKELTETYYQYTMSRQLAKFYTITAVEIIIKELKELSIQNKIIPNLRDEKVVYWNEVKKEIIK